MAPGTSTPTLGLRGGEGKERRKERSRLSSFPSQFTSHEVSFSGRHPVLPPPSSPPPFHSELQSPLAGPYKNNNNKSVMVDGNKTQFLRILSGKGEVIGQTKGDAEHVLVC